MAMPKELTKEELIKLGITDITRDGRVFVNGYERSMSIAVCKHKYGKNCKYHTFSIYDKELRDRQIKEKRSITNGIRILVLSRCMYAWFYGKADARMDIDHINNNSLDDRIENLQLLTRQQNLAKRLGNKNHWQIINGGE